MASCAEKEPVGTMMLTGEGFLEATEVAMTTAVADLVTRGGGIETLPGLDD